ncbi:hypothetical protein GCM10008932_07480 [Alkalibacterium iburiense]|uniref:Barstar (barnase inhibitor) domain-containing protein n=1 Tax=Alkalibacterium iburiense TaxID=290589 RepID=A0ABN0X7I2_9LACT
MRIIQLDGRDMTDKDSIHQYLQEKLGIVEYYGHNLDALYDILSTWDEEITIQLSHSEDVLSHLDRYGETLLNTLQEASLENDSLTIEIK